MFQFNFILPILEFINEYYFKPNTILNPNSRSTLKFASFSVTPMLEM